MQIQGAISLIKTEGFFEDTKTNWADLGCGSGLFTRALASLLYPGSLIYAVDKNVGTLKIPDSINSVSIEIRKSDFTSDSFHLKDLEGILMANALHFVFEKKTFLNKTIAWFREKPLFLIVEYDTDNPNPWVPYPLSFPTLKNLFTELGYSRIKKLHQTKSLYNNANLYSVMISQ